MFFSIWMSATQCFGKHGPCAVVRAHHEQFGSLAHQALFLFGVWCFASGPAWVGIASMHSDEVKEEVSADLHLSIYSKAKNRFCDLHCLHHHDGLHLHRAVQLIGKDGLSTMVS